MGKNFHNLYCEFVFFGGAFVKKTYTVLCVFIAFCFVSLSAVCVVIRGKSFPEFFRATALMSAALALPDGELEAAAVTEEIRPNPQKVVKTQTSYFTNQYTQGVFSEDPSVYAEEAQYPVIERQYCEGEESASGFIIKNATAFSFDPREYSENDLGFDFDNKSKKVQVLIVHTHTTESYLSYDSGTYHESFYPRSDDEEKNMVRVGEEIVKSLEANGIYAVQAKEVHDSPQYEGAYSRSRETIEKYLKEYPDIKVVLDIHRDSISTGDDGGKVKPTFTANGKKAAQIMILSGYDGDGYLDFPFWEENLTFALKLQKTAEEMYPGMTRPLYFGNFAYNMNVNSGSLLIEVGTDANTLEEAVYSGELLGNVLTRVLQSN